MHRYTLNHQNAVREYAMLQKRLFEEDQAKKAAHVDEQEKAMKQDASREFTGTLKIS
jgi:hypothetical protein